MKFSIVNTDKNNVHHLPVKPEKSVVDTISICAH